MTQPTQSGKVKWPNSDGFLPVIPRNPGYPKELPCTCEFSCLAPDCKGSCGCEACWLAWLVYDDDHAIWDETGNLVLPLDKEAIDSWQRIKDPALVHARFCPKDTDM